MKIIGIVFYFIPMALAPVLFKTFDPATAGHFAGASFVASGLLAWIMVVRAQVRPWILFIVVASTSLQCAFWAWRFVESGPLKDTWFLGIRGHYWHQILTVAYLVVGSLLFSVFKKSKPAVQ